MSRAVFPSVARTRSRARADPRPSASGVMWVVRTIRLDARSLSATSWRIRAMSSGGRRRPLRAQIRALSLFRIASGWLPMTRVDLLAPLEEQDGRDAHDAEPAREIGLVVDVDLRDHGFAGVFHGHLVDVGRERLAGPAPGGPEVDDHRGRRTARSRSRTPRSSGSWLLHPWTPRTGQGMAIVARHSWAVPGTVVRRARLVDLERRGRSRRARGGTASGPRPAAGRRAGSRRTSAT